MSKVHDVTSTDGIEKLVETRRAGSVGNINTVKKLKSSVVAAVILAMCFGVTTLALMLSGVSVKDNLFHTGEAKINLNDGNPVIQESELLFEPGMTVTKDFFVLNDGTWDEYWRLYFDAVSGDLADVLEVSIKDGETVLWSGTMSELSRENAFIAAGALTVGQRLDLAVVFHYPEDGSNAGQSSNLSFILCVDATQAKNNSNRQFD